MSIETRLRVLLVEDNDLDARTVINALGRSTEADYHVTHAGDLAQALAALADHAFDCILLDLSLPDSEGLVPVETLSQRSLHCPVVVLTGLDDPDVAIDAVRRGAQDYLIKSTITPELIERAVRYAVARHHVDVELRSATELLEKMHDRERIARDLHDTVIQRLFAAGMSLQAASAGDDDAKLRRRAIAAVDEIDAAVRELRAAIFGLNTLEEDVSLAAEISRLADGEQSALGFTPQVRIGSIERLEPELHHAVIAVVREALANVTRHAKATAAEVIVQIDGDELVVKVIDNGRGFRGEVPDPPAASTRHDGLTGHGLHNLASRASSLGGRFSIAPGRGGGCCVEWAVPWPPAEI